MKIGHTEIRTDSDGEEYAFGKQISVKTLHSTEASAFGIAEIIADKMLMMSELMEKDRKTQHQDAYQRQDGWDVWVLVAAQKPGEEEVYRRVIKNMAKRSTANYHRKNMLKMRRVVDAMVKPHRP